jgi:hypothetical protein
MAFGDRRRAKDAQHQAELDQLQAAFVTGLLERLDRTATIDDVPLALKSGERALLVIRGAGLFEPRSQGGQWKGGSHGISIPIGNSRYRYRVGRTRGHYVRSPDVPTVIDRGDVTITDRRVVFQGGKQVREWAWGKLIGFTHDDKQCTTAIQVANRQKVSGIVYTNVDPDRVHLVFEVASEVGQDNEGEAVADLRAMLPSAEPAEAVEEADSEESPEAVEPVSLTAAAPPSAPAAWAADPSGRHQYRYWDGERWTSHVADDGVEGEDPIR